MDNHTHEIASLMRIAGVSPRSLGGLVLAVVIAGCAAPGRGVSDADAVAQRAQERWNELVKGNFAGAYAYISPTGRQLVTVDAYSGGLRRNFWTDAKVGDVTCPTSEACEVDVWIEYQHWGLKMRTPVKEKWVKQSSNWWFLFER